MQAFEDIPKRVFEGNLQNISIYSDLDSALTLVTCIELFVNSATPVLSVKPPYAETFLGFNKESCKKEDPQSYLG